MDALLMGRALPKPVAAARTPARPWTPGARKAVNEGKRSEGGDVTVSVEETGPVQVFPVDERDGGERTLFGMAIRWLTDSIAYYLSGAGVPAPVLQEAANDKGQTTTADAAVAPGYSSPLNKRAPNQNRIRVWSPIGPYTGSQR